MIQVSLKLVDGLGRALNTTLWILKGKGSSQICQHKKGIISGPFGGNFLYSMMISNYFCCEKLVRKRGGGIQLLMT